MSKAKKLDRPDREKIAKWLFKDSLHPTSKIAWEKNWDKLSERDKQFYLGKADKLKAMGYEQVWEKCPDCEGKGFVPNKAVYTGYIDCPTCKGTCRIYKCVPWDREKIDKLPRIETCAGCPYWKTCGRTESRNLGNLSPEMLCKLEVDQLHKILTGGE